jgi:glycine cleavage system aminomethyltransferase T
VAGATVRDADGKAIGTITSAAFSATLGVTLGMAYLPREHIGDVLVGTLAGQSPASIVPLPFARV